MAEVPGGKFKSSYYRAEMSVEPFCVDVNMATTDQYKACVETGKCDRGAVHACDPHTWDVEGRGNLPMICIDFGQAERYCKAQGKRIVSDLEWEWAARGGEEARTFPWGNDAPAEQLCWSGKEKRAMPCPIGAFPAGPYGIHDLAGNVLQWTTTTNDAVGTFRGGRGGSWKDVVAEAVKNTHRNGFKNTYRCGFLGVRCSTAVP
jgi:formylglycine-generating enzyme required for sulfatase activity